MAFDKKFGADNCCYRNGWEVNALWVGVNTEDSTSYTNVDEQSTMRVINVTAQPLNTDINQANDPVWSALTAQKVCAAYMPPDAVLVKTFPKILGDVSVGNVEEYFSMLLAHTLPAKDFTDSNGNPEKPGVFFVYFDYHYDSNHIGSCSVGTREKDTLGDV